MESKLERNKFIQVCILARDVKKTAEEWAKFLKVDVPPIGITEGQAVTRATFNGQPCEGRIYQAVINLDNTVLEIVGPVDDEPSVWRECLDRDGEGLHHIALYTKDMDDSLKELTDAGYKVAQRGYWPAQPKDGAYAYLDTIGTLKCFVELLEF